MDSIVCDIVIPVYNAPHQVRVCVESLLAFRDDSRYRVVLIDDGSDDFTRTYLRNLKGVVLLENEENLGFLKTANRGLTYSNSDFVCLLSSHTVIADWRWLEKMIDYARRHSDVGLISPLSNKAINHGLKLHPGADIHLMADLIQRYSASKYPDAVTANACCMVVRRSLIERIGGFDEVYGKGGWADSDYHYRAIEAGFSCKVADDVFIYCEDEGRFFGEPETRYKENRQIFDQRWAQRNVNDMARFNDSQVLGYLRDENGRLKISRLHDGYDVIFVLLTFETSNVVIAVVQLVNEMIRRGIKATAVVLKKGAHPVEIRRYFAPLYIDEAQWLEQIPRSGIYVATHSLTALPVFEAAHRHEARAFYFIQDDERQFEDNNSWVEATYGLIPNHVYVSNWMEEAFAAFASFYRVIHNGVYRDQFYPVPKSGPDARRIHVAMMACDDPAGGFYEGITAINRLIEAKREYFELVFLFFGTREVYAHEIRTEHFHNYGIAKPKTLAHIFRDADIVIDSSLVRGFRLTAMAAMASGCACVLPREAEATDFARHMENALFFRGKDVDDLYEKLRLLLDCPDLRRRFQAQGPQLPDRFDPCLSAREMARLVQDPQALAPLPSRETAAYYKIKMLLLEKQLAARDRQQAQTIFLKNELEALRDRYRYYMEAFHSQEIRIQQLETQLQQAGIVS